MRVKAGSSASPFLGLGAALAFAAAAGAPSAPARAGDDRTISFYHIHTKETLTLEYKRDGRFLPEAMKKINWILRDWRKDQATTMDPNTVDIIWEMHRELGSHEPVHIISGYRSPATNEMLRKTRGGQAKQSQHMTGKAIDIAFPDVPLRRMRYSAMIRERGGVGFYPTSGIPFVHVDTGRVRHWPRMLHDELALLFPSGHSKHQSASGPISPADVTRARERRKDLAQEVAQFYALRDQPKTPIKVAAAAPLPAPPAPKVAVRPPPSPHQRMAVGAPMPPRAATEPMTMASLVAMTAEPPPAPVSRVTATGGTPAVTALPPPPAAPALVAAPKPVERPSAFVAKLPDADRSRLDTLVKLASLDPAAAPLPEAAAKPPLVTGSTGRTAAPLKTAAMTPSWPSFSKPAAVTDTGDGDAPASGATSHPFGTDSSDWRSGWLVAPEYDEDHPEELSYRPFALAPLLTETSSFDDPALATLVHPDADAAIELLDDEGTVLPMQFGPGHAATAMAWAQQFSGEAVHLTGMIPTPASQQAPRPQLAAARAVKTEPR